MPSYPDAVSPHALSPPQPHIHILLSRYTMVSGISCLGFSRFRDLISESIPRFLEVDERMIFLLRLTCNERAPLNICGPPFVNSQPIFIMKTIPESVEVKFLQRKLISGVHKGAGYQLVAQEEDGIMGRN
jgi:hypothetical protein